MSEQPPGPDRVLPPPWPDDPHAQPPPWPCERWTREQTHPGHIHWPPHQPDLWWCPGYGMPEVGPMPITTDRAYQNSHRLAWACPHDATKVTVWARTRAGALPLATDCWTWHRRPDGDCGRDDEPSTWVRP